jgi:hypothetical protein
MSFEPIANAASKVMADIEHRYNTQAIERRLEAAHLVIADQNKVIAALRASVSDLMDRLIASWDRVDLAPDGDIKAVQRAVDAAALVDGSRNP